MKEPYMITDEEYQKAIKQLISETKGMRENVHEAIEDFKQKAYPYADKALHMLVDQGYLNADLTPTGGKGQIFDEVYQAFFSHMGDGERVMPDGVRVVWDALCSCYIVPDDDKKAVA